MLFRSNMHNPTAINNLDQISVRVYPNPTSNEAKISFTLANSQMISVKIFNAAGNMVYSLQNIYKTAGNNVINWNGNDGTGTKLQSGIYFIKLEANNKIITKKLVIMK